MDTRFIELAGEINTAMPAYVVGRVAEALNDARQAGRGSKVLILGMAYKKDVDDPRESPVVRADGFAVRAGRTSATTIRTFPCCRRCGNWPQAGEDEKQPLDERLLAEQDCVLIATDHTAYDYRFIVQHAQVIVDTRNATREVMEGREKIVKA